jgi:hypothetical protein
VPNVNYRMGCSWCPFRAHQHSSSTSRAAEQRSLTEKAHASADCLDVSIILMISINSISACLIVALSIYLLLCNDEFDSRNYEIKGDSGIWLPESTNAGGHVYPYMATIVSMTCLLTLVMMIICFGSQFTG